MEAKGDASQEELEALAADLSSKMLLTTWKGTRWEVNSVVGEVVDAVLHEPGLAKGVGINRAKVRVCVLTSSNCNCSTSLLVQAIMTIGGIFKSAVPDETDDERREIERQVFGFWN